MAFLAAIAASLGVRLWLAARQIGHVRAHRSSVPAAFAPRVDLAAHRKAADYTVARQRVAIVHAIVDAALLVALTLGGGLAAMVVATGSLPGGPIVRDLALFGLLGATLGAASLPFTWWHTFRVEERFGFNRITMRLWLTDLAKAIGVALVLGVPLLAVLLWIMHGTGAWWWLAAWFAWIGFQLLVLVLYPTVIAPVFNRFTPMADTPLRDRVEALLARCGFRSAGLFVMDGSRRSGHGNAYFTGLGRAKRIVFFDTLLARLDADEIEAVLAHELGHFTLRHVTKRIAWSAALALAFLVLLAWLAQAPWFHVGLGIPPALVPAALARPGVALALFLLALPPFTFLLEPVVAAYSRRHEFEADAFALRHTGAEALATALVKLYEDNAATLTPDPVHSAFYDSHPPAIERIERLRTLAADAATPLAA